MWKEMIWRNQTYAYLNMDWHVNDAQCDDCEPQNHGKHDFFFFVNFKLLNS